jgi:hypothetical protein
MRVKNYDQWPFVALIRSGFLIGRVRYGCLHYYKITDARENIPGSHILGEIMNLTYKIDIHA